MLTLSNRSHAATLLEAAALTADDASSPAIIFVQTGQEDLAVTRSQFSRRVHDYAAALHHAGLRARDLLIVADVQSLESMYAFWGTLCLGAIPSMFPALTEKLDPEIYMRNMRQLVALSDVRAIFTSDDFAPQLAASVDCMVLGPERLATGQAHESLAAYAPEAGETAFLQHSSGTTGLQKGVALSHRSVLNQLASYSDRLQPGAEDVIVSWLPLYHDMGLIAGFILPLFQGIPLVMMSPFDWVRNPALLFRAIDHYKGTLCWLPNFAYNHCARRIRASDVDGLSLATMRAFINCSEPVHYESHQLFLERFADLGVTADKLAVSYAMAENVFAVTQSPIGQPAHVDWIDREQLVANQRAELTLPDEANAAPQVSCGSPIPEVELRILDTNGGLLPDRHVGEIAIRTGSLFDGYYHRADLQPFTSGGWYATGDRGYLADGELYVVGRSKDMIINAGKNIYPQDIEAIVNDVEGVHPGRAVVFGVPDEREGTELIAVVAEVKTEEPELRQEIARRIRQKVSQQTMVTVTYVHLVGPHWLIKTSSGKIARSANRDKWHAARG